jgi:hypothetical protein
MGGQGELSDRESERVREIKVLREITVRLTQAYDSLYAWLQAYAVRPDDNPRIVIESTLRACGLLVGKVTSNATTNASYMLRETIVFLI